MTHDWAACSRGTRQPVTSVTYWLQYAAIPRHADIAA